MNAQKLTLTTKREIRAYGLWRTMATEDEMRITYERAIQAADGRMNEHVCKMHEKNYKVCLRAVVAAEARLELR